MKVPKEQCAVALLMMMVASNKVLLPILHVLLLLGIRALVK